MKIPIPLLKIGIFVHKDTIQINSYKRKRMLLLMFPFSFAYFSNGRYDLEWNVFKKLGLRIWDKKEEKWIWDKK
jgi:hypothetical protein